MKRGDCTDWLDEAREHIVYAWRDGLGRLVVYMRMGLL